MNLIYGMIDEHGHSIDVISTGTLCYACQSYTTIHEFRQDLHVHKIRL